MSLAVIAALGGAPGERNRGEQSKDVAGAAADWMGAGTLARLPAVAGRYPGGGPFEGAVGSAGDGWWVLGHPSAGVRLSRTTDNAGMGAGASVGVHSGTGIDALICSYSWSCDEALRVMWCESRGDPGAVSPDGQNVGLFQINLVHGYYPGAAENVAKAHAIWLDSSWIPWSCKP